AVCATVLCCAVEIAVRTDNQSGHRVCAVSPKKRSDRCQDAVCRYPEHVAYAAHPAVASRSVKTSIRRQRQRTKRSCTIRRQRGKSAQNSSAQRTKRHFEKRAGPINAG